MKADPDDLTGYSDEQAVNVPTPESIRQITAEIRKTWSKAVRQRRSVGQPRHVETGFVDLAAYNRRVP